MTATDAMQEYLRLQKELEERFFSERAKLQKLRTTVDDAIDRLEVFYEWLAKQLHVSAQIPTAATMLLQRVAFEFGVSVWEVETRKNSKQAVPVRHLAITIYQETTGASLQAIGKVFGVDRSTVLHAIRNTEKRMADETFKAHAEKLRRELQNHEQ